MCFQLLLVEDLYENQTLKILNFISESPGSMKDISEHLQLDFFLFDSSIICVKIFSCFFE